ncbi:MAG: hypothetical protein H7255_14560 [Ramlibacter sp.]|nr:hypothetical protein [Ramlibacter sp.]
MAWLAIPDFSLGLNRDALPEETPLGTTTNARNMRFRNGFAERANGMQTVYTTPTFAPYHICHYTVGTTRFIVYTGLQKTAVDDGTTRTDITLANNTGAIDDRWCGFVFNGVYIQNNGVDVPQFWGGNPAVKLANLTGWPAGYKAGFMRAFGSYIIAGDITRGGIREPDTILWSSATEPGAIPSTWNIADATKDAGDIPIADTNGNLIDCMPLGDMNVIYKDDSLHYQQVIQNNFVFRFGRLPGATGLLARGCVQNYPGGHVYLTPGFDLMTHSGQGASSILEGRMQRWLASTINASRATRSFLVASPATNEILVCFPSGSSLTCDMALVWNYKDNTFGVRDLVSVTYGSTGQVALSDPTATWSAAVGLTWATMSRTWGFSDYASNSPRVILSRTTPALAIYDAGTTDFGAAFPSSMEATGIHFGAKGQVKFVRGVRPVFDAPDGTVIQVQVGSSMSARASPTYGPAVNFNVGWDVEVYPSTTGRFLAIKFSTASGVSWRIRSCEIDVVQMGTF